MSEHRPIEGPGGGDPGRGNDQWIDPDRGGNRVAAAVVLGIAVVVLLAVAVPVLWHVLWGIVGIVAGFVGLVIGGLATIFALIVALFAAALVFLPFIIGALALIGLIWLIAKAANG